MKYLFVLTGVAVLILGFQNCPTQTSPGGQGSGNSTQEIPGQVTCNGGITMSCNPGDQVSCNGSMITCPGDVPPVSPVPSSPLLKETVAPNVFT